MEGREWQIDEFRQVGTDFTDIYEVERYDERMGSFRDLDGENRGMLEMLKLPAGASVLDIGCGTGRFVRYAAAAGLCPSCADISPVMLEYVRKKVAEEGLNEIITQNAGFISMDFPAESFDAVVSGAALHHLPDLWKLSALMNIARVLKPGGQFILRDVIFTCESGIRPEDTFKRFAESFPNMSKEAARHVASEFSTFDWIIEGLLERAGFKIISANTLSESFMVYHCQKME